MWTLVDASACVPRCVRSPCVPAATNVDREHRAQIHFDARVGTSRATVSELDAPSIRLRREHRAARALRLRTTSSMPHNGANVDLPFSPMTVTFRDLRYR